MYHNDEEDLYMPRIRPAAMPSRSKYTPYFSGCADGLKDFLEEFEGRAFNRIMTDRSELTHSLPMQTLSSRVLCNGSRLHDWPQFRQSLVNVISNTTTWHLAMKQKWCSYVHDSSGR
jgi:hypothetical protein